MNIKRKYVQVKALGATVTMEPQEVPDWVKYELEGEPYELTEIELTDEEADAIPEFAGY